MRLVWGLFRQLRVLRELSSHAIDPRYSYSLALARGGRWLLIIVLTSCLAYKIVVIQGPVDFSIFRNPRYLSRLVCVYVKSLSASSCSLCVAVV